MINNSKHKIMKSPRAVEIPICPFCDGKVIYTSWITHKIFQLECLNCGSHWRSGIKETPEKELYLVLTKSKSNLNSTKYLWQKHPIEFWRDMIRERI